MDVYETRGTEQAARQFCTMLMGYGDQGNAPSLWNPRENKADG
jgi:hypothetical protein